MARTALSKAIESAGGPKALGRKIGISSQAISQWQECPPLRVLDVERASGVSRHALRPDLYPASEPGLHDGVTAEVSGEIPCKDFVGLTSGDATEAA